MELMNVQLQLCIYHIYDISIIEGGSPCAPEGGDISIYRTGENVFLGESFIPPTESFSERIGFVSQIT